jgi:uncharacterized membrane protein
MDMESLLGLLVVAFIVVLVIAIKLSNRQKLDTEMRKVVKTRIVDVSGKSTSTTRTSTGSAVGRAVIGGAIAGPVGAAVGAATARQKTSTENDDIVVFKVWYKDGTTAIKKISRKSDYYDAYLEKLED